MISNINNVNIKNQGRELIEFSIHTKFSSLDGISSPAEYIKSAKDKGYKGIVVTDHSTVQSFPEFSMFKKENENFKIFYGCEFEMVEDNYPSYIFLSSYKQENTLKKDFYDLTYCAFDLETTGLSSLYDEIIEIGYVIWKGKEIICQESFLVKPKQEISPEITRIVGLSNEDLEKGSDIAEVLKKVFKKWKESSVDLVFAHNALKFDLQFLRKYCKEIFLKDISYPFLDTLLLSRIAIPNKKSYTLENLVNAGRSKENKIEQEHRSLGDSILLKNLIEKIIKIGLENNFSSWRDFSSLINKKTLERGTKIIAIAKNQKGLTDLYKLVKIAHVDNYLKRSILFRSDVKKNRKNLIIGASSDNESEIFQSFSSFNSDSEKKKKILFYDYLEIRPPQCFSHLTLSYRIRENDLKKIILSIINFSYEIGVKVVSSNNVHYCDKIQKKIKDIVISNPAINGIKHDFYKYATFGNNDNFNIIPFQHLKSETEIIENWSFIENDKVIQRIVFENPQEIISNIEEIKILKKNKEYPSYQGSEKEIMDVCSKKMKIIFGESIPKFVLDRLKEEWKVIKKKYLSVYWLSWKIVSKAQSSGNIVGSRGSVGCSFIAYLLNITDINPLPLHSICNFCKNYELLNNKKSSCYDFKQSIHCNKCQKGKIFYDGHSLPFETFVGWEGEKVPDIDLNFSGEYQKVAHNYLREILGKDNVYRIGTVNKLSSQTAENFWEEHLKLRKNINENFVLWDWCKEFFYQINNKNIFLAKEFAIEQLKGIKRTTGQHPGGLLIIPPSENIIETTPLNYPADDKDSEWLTTHFEYSFLSQIFLKMDVLGHDEPTVLEKLHKMTGVDSLDNKKVRFDDEKIMDVFLSCDTLGIPEFGTELVKKNLLEKIKPDKFSQLVQISGFSHGKDVWLQNQLSLFKEKKMSIEKLLACREDILDLLRERGVEKKEAFVATEFIRKGKWEKLDDSIKNQIKSKMNDEEGKIYFSILEKIKYIFPKPHAIAYTMTAWRTAYYKVYYPEKFYSVLLTYHASVYDIWLMTFDTVKAIPIRMNDLLDNFSVFKNVKKEFISVCKVLVKISKDDHNVKNFLDEVLFSSKNYYQILDVEKNFSIQELKIKYSKKIKENEQKILQESIKEKRGFRVIDNLKKELKVLNNSYEVLLDNQKREYYNAKISIREKIEKNFSNKEVLFDWKLTAREKDLFFTLKVVFEIKKKGYDFSIGLDFNSSDVDNFSFSNGKLLIPFLAVNGIGESVSKKIVDYRNKNGRINEWKIELANILNKKHFSQFSELEKNDMIFS